MPNQHGLRRILAENRVQWALISRHDARIPTFYNLPITREHTSVSGYYTERTLQQIPVPKEIHSALKTYAKENDRTLNVIYDEMVDWFLETKKKDLRLTYVSSPKGIRRYTSLWIDNRVLERAKQSAVIDDVSMNRVIYSAMVHYLYARTNQRTA